MHSVPAAHARLAELAMSLAAHVGDARATFYRTAFDAQKRAIGPEHRSDVVADARGERAARTATIGRTDHYAEIATAISDAAAGLRLVVATGYDATALQLWEGTHRDRIGTAVDAALTDSQIAIFEAVGRLLIRPDLR